MQTYNMTTVLNEFVVTTLQTLMRVLMAELSAWFTSPYSNADFSIEKTYLVQNSLLILCRKCENCGTISIYHYTYNLGSAEEVKINNNLYIFVIL